MKRIFGIICLMLCLTVAACGQESSENAVACKFFIDVRSEDNLLLNKYDISITLDGDEIGTVANGDEFTYLTTVMSGNHTLVFIQAGETSPKAIKNITLKEDMTYSCKLAHDKESIDILDEKRQSGVAGAAIEVPDVTGKVLSEALKELKDLGFSNVREEPYKEILNKKNWIVTSQSVAAGEVVDKGEFIQLDCVKEEGSIEETPEE